MPPLIFIILVLFEWSIELFAIQLSSISGLSTVTEVTCLGLVKVLNNIKPSVVAT